MSRRSKAVALAGAALIAASSVGSVLASSHREAPLIAGDPAADNTDLYAFLNPTNPSRLTIIANYIPLEEPAGGPNFFPFDPSVLFVIGGDCTSHAGAMAGIRRARPGIRLGICWFDAHGDFNTPATTPSGNVWGMPFAMLLGHGDEDLVAACDGPTADARDAALLGGQVLDEQESRMLAASRVAHCEEFILGFPQGYDTVVGERGIKLSGGQRQRVAIARAILADPKLLILDEATSSLDSESEGMIQDGLRSLRRGRTTFVIAHRLSTIQSADQILVLEGGEIVEQGTHEELLRKAGRYRQLYDKQYRFELDRFINPGEDFTPELPKAVLQREAGEAIRAD